MIDVVRLAVRYKPNNNYISTASGGLILEKLKKYAGPDCSNSKNTLVAFRVLCNLFVHPAGEEAVVSNKLAILENIAGLNTDNKNIEVSSF